MNKLREKLFDIFFLIAFSREREIIYLMGNSSNFYKAEGVSVSKGAETSVFHSVAKHICQNLTQEPSLSVFCRKLFSDFIVVQIMV